MSPSFGLVGGVPVGILTDAPAVVEALVCNHAVGELFDNPILLSVPINNEAVVFASVVSTKALFIMPIYILPCRRAGVTLAFA